ncbi:MAG: hypothetical protein K2X27_18250 [Candidatus Obscuribacterales bacterium]|nr:hypothetical protein [Candidatus Obscuribacterales bacterium]
MAANLYSSETIHLKAIAEDDCSIEQIRLGGGDLLTRSAIGESLVLANGVQVMIRAGYFSIMGAHDLTVERRKDGSTLLLFRNGDELVFNGEGIQSIRRSAGLLKFERRQAAMLNQQHAIVPSQSCYA